MAVAVQSRDKFQVRVMRYGMVAPEVGQIVIDGLDAFRVRASTVRSGGETRGWTELGPGDYLVDLDLEYIGEVA